MKNKNQWKLISLFTLLTCLGSFGFVFGGYLLSYVLQSSIDQKAKQTFIFISFSSSLFLTGAVFKYLASLVKSVILKNFNNDLRKKILINISNFTNDELASYKNGEMVSWLTNDVNQIELKSYENFLSIISESMNLCLAFIALFMIHWIILLFCIFLSVIMWLVPKLIQNKLQKTYLGVSTKQEEFTKKAENIISGYEEFNLNNANPRFVDLVAKSGENLEKYKIKNRFKESILYFVLTMLTIFFQFSIILMTVLLSMNKIVLISAVLSVTQLSGTFFASLQSFVNNFFVLKSNNVLLKKFDINQDIACKNSNKNDDFKFESINCSNLSYKIEGKTILNNLNLDINKNDKMLLIGPSGSGKTTLFNILLKKKQKYEGNIYLNKNIEFDLVSKKSLYSNFDFVGQQPILFNATLKENLTLFDNTIEDKIILDALAKTNMINWFEKNGSNINMLLNSEYKNISAGELQRLSLARALIRNKEVLLLDEITANLDKNNKEIIENIILSLDKTVLLISHSISEIEKKQKFKTINF